MWVLLGIMCGEIRKAALDPEKGGRPAKAERRDSSSGSPLSPPVLAVDCEPSPALCFRKWSSALALCPGTPVQVSPQLTILCPLLSGVGKMTCPAHLQQAAPCPPLPVQLLLCLDPWKVVLGHSSSAQQHNQVKDAVDHLWTQTLESQPHQPNERH